MRVKNGNLMAERRNIHHKEVPEEPEEHHQLHQSCRLPRKCYILKLFLNLGCFPLYLADPEELTGTGSSDDLANFLNIFFKMNKTDEHDTSYQLP